MNEVRIYEPGSRPELFRNPGIFLSASVPYLRDHDEDGADAPGAAARARNLWYVESSRPDRIRQAVIELCRNAFRRHFNLVFGGHPAISPLVLQAARQFTADETEVRVVIFQSAYFLKSVPRESFELGDWELGELLWTRARGKRSESLTEMRRTMVDERHNLHAAVAIGGMEGIHEEIELFREGHRAAPVFPVGSTGSAARELLDRLPVAPDLPTSALLDNPSYPQVMQSIFGVLGHE